MITQIPASVVSFIRPTSTHPATTPPSPQDKPLNGTGATPMIELVTTAATRRRNNSLLSSTNLQKVTELVQGIAELVHQIRQTIELLRTKPTPNGSGAQSQPLSDTAGAASKVTNPDTTGAPPTGATSLSLAGQPVTAHSSLSSPAALSQPLPNDTISILTGLTQRLQELIQSLGQIFTQLTEFNSLTGGAAFGTPNALAQAGAEKPPQGSSSWKDGIGTLLDIGLSLLPFGSIAKGAKGILKGAGKLLKKLF